MVEQQEGPSPPQHALSAARVHGISIDFRAFAADPWRE